MSKLCTKAALVIVFETPIVYGWRVKIYSTHSQIRNEVFKNVKKENFRGNHCGSIYAVDIIEA